MNEKDYITIEAQELKEMRSTLQKELKDQIEVNERTIELRAYLDMIDWFNQRNIYERDYKIKN
jgi:hypothetical protein